MAGNIKKGGAVLASPKKNRGKVSVGLLKKTKGGESRVAGFAFPPPCLLPLHPQVTGAAIPRPGVQVTARGGDGRMAQGGLHQVDRGASVKGMGSLAMPGRCEKPQANEPLLYIGFYLCYRAL